MQLKTTFMGYDMNEVLKRFERLNNILDQMDEGKVSKEMALQLFDALAAEPFKKQLTGYDRKAVEAQFADIRRQLEAM